MNQQVNRWFEFCTWMYNLNIGNLFLVLNFYVTKDIESGVNKERGKKNDRENTGCIWEWGFSGYV
jgi:hypothetical protein